MRYNELVPSHISTDTGSVVDRK